MVKIVSLRRSVRSDEMRTELILFVFVIKCMGYENAAGYGLMIRKDGNHGARS